MSEEKRKFNPGSAPVWVFSSQERAEEFLGGLFNEINTSKSGESDLEVLQRYTETKQNLLENKTSVGEDEQSVD